MAEASAQAVQALRDQTGAGMMDCKRALADAGGDLKKAVGLLRERGLAKAGKREGRATSEGAIAIHLGEGRGGMVEVGCETDFVARTGPFVELVDSLAREVSEGEAVTGVDALLAASIDGEKVADRITAAIAKLGENVVVKRVARLAVDGSGVVGGYLHAGGKLGVLVALDTPGAASDVEPLAKDLAMHVAAADPTPIAVDRDDVPPDVLEAERGIYRKQAEQSGKPEKVVEKIVEGRLRKFTAEICLLQQPFVKDPDRSVGELIKEVAGRSGVEVRVAAFERFRLGGAGES